MPTIEEVKESIARIQAAMNNCNENERHRLMFELIFHQNQLLSLMLIERARIVRQNENMEKFLDKVKKRRNWMWNSFTSLLINFTFYILLFSCYNFKRRLCVWVSNSGTQDTRHIHYDTFTSSFFTAEFSAIFEPKFKCVVLG